MTMKTPRRNCASARPTTPPETPATLDQFIRAAHDVMLAFLMRRLGNRHTAEDLAQQALLAVLHPDFDPSRDDAIGFVKQRARWLVQEQHRRPVPVPRSLHPELIDPRAASPDQALELAEHRDRARRLIAEAMDSLLPRAGDVRELLRP
jgi:DNA-directed RNA polymerase specialized sigma24 family protein